MRKFYIPVIILMMMLASCEDYLHVSSPSTFDKDYIFNNESEIATAVNGMYVPMTGGKGWVGTMANSMLFNTDVEFTPVNNASTLKESAYEPSTGNINSYNSVWTGMYDGINRANDVIEGIEQSSLYTETDRRKPSRLMHYYGEAKVLRAMYYLELVRNWGDVPYRRKSAGDKNELFIGATDRDTILTHMINDLIEVEPVMLYAEESDRGVEAASREFCQALIARMALQRGGWTLRPDYANPAARGTMKRSDDWQEYYKIAEKYAGKVINEGKHTLSRSFRQLWEDECNWIVPVSDDNIFDVPAKVGGSGEIGYTWGTYIVSQKNSEGQNASNAPHGYSSGGSKLALTYMLSFDSKDLRRDITCEMFRYENSGTSNIVQKPIAGFTVFCGKWNRLFMKSPLGSTSNKGTGINYTYMRYTDVLLMYAEAANENHDGPTPQAKDALKKVRTRAFAAEDKAEKVDDYVDRLNSKQDFFDAIVKERAWEFGGEKHRRFDLARWNLYSKTIYNLYFDWITLGKVARTKQYENSTTPFEEPTYDPRFDSYPVVTYYKMVKAVNPVAVCVSETIDWYKEGDKSSYDQSLAPYPSKVPTDYKQLDMCNQYITQVKNTSNPRQWVPATTVQFSFYGYINESNASTVNPEVDPVRYLIPISPDALSSHQGLLKNYYGY